MTNSKLLILASPHLDNPGRDYVNPVIDEVLAPQRQQEMVEIVHRLEELAERDDEVNEDHGKHLADSFALARSEAHQIGFRLARELGHPKVYAVDWLPAWTWSLKSLPESMARRACL